MYRTTYTVIVGDSFPLGASIAYVKSKLFLSQFNV